MNTKEVEPSVYKYFKSGYHCAEVISKTILERLSPVSHAEVLKAVSGFGGGIAGTMTELCGAFTGGVFTVGVLYGRQRPADDLEDCGLLITAYKNFFQDEFGSLNCPTIIDNLEPEDVRLGCANLTVRATSVLLEMLQIFESQAAVSTNPTAAQSLVKDPLQRCPFSNRRRAVPV